MTIRPRLDLKVGFACNNRCWFCVQGDKRERIAPRSSDEIREVLRERSSTLDSVVFTGGEPTVRKDLVELVAYARELGYTSIQLQTNGRRLAYMTYARALVAAGMTEFAPSLHGSSADIHEGLTRAPGSWAQTIAGIRNVRALGLPIITNSVVTKSNASDLPALAALLVSLGVDQIQFAYVHPGGTAGENFDDVVPRFDETIPSLHRALDVVGAAGIRAFTEAVPYCFMRGYEDCIAERVIPETCVVDQPVVIESYTEYRWKEGKAHGPPCATCAAARICEGPWREYPHEHGWGEFQPLSVPPPR